MIAVFLVKTELFFSCFFCCNRGPQCVVTVLFFFCRDIVATEVPLSLLRRSQQEVRVVMELGQGQEFLCRDRVFLCHDRV